MSRISPKAAAALQDGTGASASPAENSNAAEVRAFFEELRRALQEETLGVQRVQFWRADKRRGGRKKEGLKKAEKVEKSIGVDDEMKEKEKGKEKEKEKRKEKKVPDTLPVRVRVLYEMAAIGPRDIRDLLVVRSPLLSLLRSHSVAVDSISCDLFSS